MEMLKRECEFGNDDLREIHRVSEAFYLEAFKMNTVLILKMFCKKIFKG